MWCPITAQHRPCYHLLQATIPSRGYWVASLLSLLFPQSFLNSDLVEICHIMSPLCSEPSTSCLSHSEEDLRPHNDPQGSLRPRVLPQSLCSLLGPLLHLFSASFILLQPHWPACYFLNLPDSPHCRAFALAVPSSWKSSPCSHLNSHLLSSLPVPQ